MIVAKKGLHLLRVCCYLLLSSDGCNVTDGKEAAMANLFRREGSPHWWLRFMHKGQRFIESTGTADKREAERMLRRRQREVKEPNALLQLADRIVKGLAKEKDDAKREKERSRIIAYIASGMPDPILLKDAWNRWLQDPTKDKPDGRTLSAYEGRWHGTGRRAGKNGFIGWLAGHYPNLKYMHEITPEIAASYAAELRARETAKDTYQQHIKLVRRVFEDLGEQAGLLANPFRKIDTKSKRGPRDHKRAFTDDELKIVSEKLTEVEKQVKQGKVKEKNSVLLDAYGNMRNWFVLGFYTGMRLGDVLTLEWSEIDFKQRVIKYVPLKGRNNPNAKEVSVSIHPTLMAALKGLRRQAKKGERFVFPEAAKRYLGLGGYVRDTSAASKQIQKFLKDTCKLNIYKEGTGKETSSGKKKTKDMGRESKRPRAVVELGFHSWRHTFISMSANRNVPQVVLLELVGHGSPEVSRLYQHAGQDAIAQAIEQLPEKIG